VGVQRRVPRPRALVFPSRRSRRMTMDADIFRRSRHARSVLVLVRGHTLLNDHPTAPSSTIELLLVLDADYTADRAHTRFDDERKAHLATRLLVSGRHDSGHRSRALEGIGTSVLVVGDANHLGLEPQSCSEAPSHSLRPLPGFELDVLPTSTASALGIQQSLEFLDVLGSFRHGSAADSASVSPPKGGSITATTPPNRHRGAPQIPDRECTRAPVTKLHAYSLQLRQHCAAPTSASFLSIIASSRWETGSPRNLWHGHVPGWNPSASALW